MTIEYLKIYKIGVKIPTVKRGKFICKALKKNKAKEGNSKGSKKKKCKSNLCIVEMAGWEFLSSQDVSKLGAAKLASRVLVPNQLSLSVLKIGIHRRDVED